MTDTGSIGLRPATDADWPAIEALLAARGLPLQGAREHLDTMWVARRDGEVVGCAGVEPYGAVVLLRSVAVAPGTDRHGVGGALVARVLDEAARRGAASAWLLTTTAADWFARRGFVREPASHAPDALRASAEFRGACPASAVLMSRPLAAAADAAGGRR